MSNPRIIISGGGTGGHIFPALSIAEALRNLEPQADILFVGAQGRMEMERVPAAGYPIRGLPVAGLKRSFSAENLTLPFKVAKSLGMARRILREFRPDVAVGVGGYASAPLLWTASRMKIPTLIQEQNSYAGLTNRILGKKARRICVAYDRMERFFPEKKILLTGNPVRGTIEKPTEEARRAAYAHFALEPGKPVILLIGGSLGSATLNRTAREWALRQKGNESPCQLLWQCGNRFMKHIGSVEEATGGAPNVRLTEFIDRMDLAYAAADVILSRAGAGTISELCIVGKPVLFVPSPNVTEDHQRHNAMALVEKGAAMMVSDAEAPRTAMGLAESLLAESEKREEMSRNILSLARKNAAEIIAREVLALASKA